MRHPGSGLSEPSVVLGADGDVRGGILTFALLLVLALSAGCGDDRREEAVDPHRDLRERLGLDDDRYIHRITLGGQGAEEHLVPGRLHVGRRAVVEFVTVDGRVHTVVFPEDSLAPGAAAFLRETSQLRSPPLLDRGSRFVLTLEGAPAGRYPFRSEGAGGEAWGVILVADGS